MNKTRITYRLDNQYEKPVERLSQEERKNVIPLYENEFRVVNEVRPLPEYTNDYGAWNSPIDAETRRIEQLIRESNTPPRKTSLPPRANEDLSVYEIEQRFRHEEYTENSTHTTSGTMYLRRNIPWFKVAGTAIGAVVTGVLLGYLILTMFSGANTIQDKSTTGEVKAITNDPAKEASVVVPSGAVQAGLIPVQIPARTYTFLQNGGFSTLARANQAGEEIRKQGLAAVTESSDKFFVYVGVAVDRNSALPLSEQLQAKSLEIYKKPYSLPALQTVKWNGNAEFLQNYCTQADQLVQMLSGITLVHIEESQLTAISDTTLQSVQSSFETWTATSAQVLKDAAENVKPALQKMTNAMNTAKLSLDEYKKKPSLEMLWQAQTNVLQFIITEKALLSDIATV